MKRLFLAADLSIPVVERLVRAQEEISRTLLDKGVSMRWVDAPNIHVTLKFLGEQDDALIPMICEQVHALARPLFPFDVGCQGLGVFPKAERPRILWAGLDTQGAEVMGLLHQTLERDLAEIGIAKEEREFKPHVTLGRIKSAASVDLTTIRAALSDADFGRSYVRDIALFQSELTPNGPTYTVLERFKLGE